MGFSDLQPPTAAAVRACAAKIGPKRAFYGTDDTVRDLDRLRHALGVERMALDGTSYGTYVAERYALAYPRHVSRLVLDSVVPHEASGQLETQAFPRVAQVLRKVCGRCADDLRAVVARYHNGTKLLDAIVTLSVVDPTYRTQFDLPLALAEARRGNPRPMNGSPVRHPASRGVRARVRPEPGPAREHALRRLALAVGRLVGAARGPRHGAGALRGVAAEERARTLRAGDRRRQRDHAAVPLLAAHGAVVAAAEGREDLGSGARARGRPRPLDAAPLAARRAEAPHPRQAGDDPRLGPLDPARPVAQAAVKRFLLRWLDCRPRAVSSAGRAGDS